MRLAETILTVRPRASGSLMVLSYGRSKSKRLLMHAGVIYIYIYMYIYIYAYIGQGGFRAFACMAPVIGGPAVPYFYF